MPRLWLEYRAMNWLGEKIQNHIEPTDTVLDLGCGIMGATDDLKCKVILGCDVWYPYLEKICHLWPTVKVRMNELDRFVDNSYDVVLCLDVLEHLDKGIAVQALEEMKRICRKKVIIYTPRLFQTNEESVENAWNLGYNPHQKHICQIEIPLLNEFGYKTEIMDVDGGILGIYTK